MQNIDVPYRLAPAKVDLRTSQLAYGVLKQRNLCAKSASPHDYEAQYEGENEKVIAIAQIDRRLDRDWQTCIKHAFNPSGNLLTILPTGSMTAEIPVLAARTSGKPSATARTRACWKCWIGPGADAEPAIVRDVDEPARPLPGWHRGVGKDGLVAYQRQHFWRAGYVHRAPAITRQKSADDLCELHQPDPFKQPLERQVLAERNQMHLVIDAADRTVGIDDIDRIVGLRIAGVGVGRRVAPRR